MEALNNPQELFRLGIAALIEIIITGLFCRSLIKTLSHVKPTERAIKPVVIWLLLIPGLKYLLNLLVVFGMSKSIRNELVIRDYEEVKKPAFSTGLIYAISSLLTLAALFISVPKEYIVIISIIGFLQILFFVQYWMKINWYRNILQKDEAGSQE